MGSMCSSKHQEDVTPMVTPTISINQNYASKLREFAKDMRIQRQRVEQLQEYAKEFMTQIKESENKDPNMDTLFKQSQELDLKCSELLTDMELRNEKFGGLIDECERGQLQNVTTDALNSGEKAIASYQDKYKELDKLFIDYKKEWRKYLVDNDNSQQLIDDLSLMLKRIEDESNNYQNLINEVKDKLEDLQKLLMEVLEDSDVKKDYGDKQESLQTHKEKISLNQATFNDVNTRFAAAIQRLQELKQSFSMSIQDVSKITCQQLEKINEEAHKFLEINQNLGSDIMNLQKSLIERREKLLDLDIKENIALRRVQFETLYNQALIIEEGISVVIQALEFKQISSIDQDSQRQLGPLRQEADAINRKLQDKVEILGELNQQILELERMVDDNENSERLKTAALKNLFPYILQIGKLASKIEQVKKDIESVQHELEMKKVLMGETKIEEKVNSHSQLSLQHKESLEAIKSEISTMLGLFADLYDYASDDEESHNIELIQASVEQLKDQIDSIEEKCQTTSLEIEDLINEIQELEGHKGQLNQLISRVGEIEKELQENDKLVEDLNDRVNKKAQRFNEFDLKSKYGKRIRQLEEGKNYRTKVKNRSNKMIRKINEKYDLPLKEEDQQKLEELKLLAQSYKSQYEELSKVHDGLQEKLEQDLQKQIPDDPLSISIQDQIRLLKEMKTVKTKLMDNNKKLLALREALMQMQDKVHEIQEFKLEDQGEDSTPMEDPYDYQAQPNDQMDSLMSDYLNNGSKKVQVEIKRLAPGQYLFGSKKILTKVINGKLMVRVGGGIMQLEEFIQTYAEKELQKQMDKEYEDLNSVNSFSNVVNIVRKKTQRQKNSDKMLMSDGSGSASASASHRSQTFRKK